MRIKTIWGSIIVIAILTIILINSINGSIIRHSTKEEINFLTKTPSSILFGEIYTSCNNIEKTSTIIFGVYNDIDIDDNTETGINGKDIRVQYLVLPWLNLEKPAIVLTLLVNIDRLGEEIKDKDILAEIRVNEMEIGFHSPNLHGNELPESIQFTTTFFINLLDKTIGFTMKTTPMYDDKNNKTLSYSIKHNDTRYEFTLKPPVETQVMISSTMEPKTWLYEFKREKGYKTMLTILKTKRDKETEIKIYDLPETISFKLKLTPLQEGGGNILYQSNKNYDTNIKIVSDETGRCRYITLSNLPSMMNMEWNPSRGEGYYKLVMESKTTTINMYDNPVEPTINITLTTTGNIDFTTQWNLTNPGEIIITKNEPLALEFKTMINNWLTQVNISSMDGNLTLKWNINTTGYILYDTNWKPVKTINLLVMNPSKIGVRTEATASRADDFNINWVLWPIEESSINVTGRIDFSSMMIDVYLNGEWYHLWPWI